MEELNTMVYQITNELMREGHKPLAISAIYIMIALQIYRTTMSDDEYNTIVDHISNSRDKVKKLLDLEEYTMIGNSDTVH